MRGCCSQTRNLMVGICPHTVGKRAGALAHVIPLRAGCPFCLARAAFPLPLGCATVLGQGTPSSEEFMHSQALAMDWIFQPARWRPAGWLAEWLRYRAARHLERRQASRQKVVNLAAHYWDGTAAVSHIVRDVSTSGAFIFADFKWPPGTIVTLTLQLESHPAPTTLVRTKVVRSVPDGLGVQFLCLSK